MRDIDRDQLGYYSRTAATYDHVHGGALEHLIALHHIAAYVDVMNLQSVLDTGCGTGRGMKFLVERYPQLAVHGNDPSAAMLAESGLPSEMVDNVSSEALPYRDSSFDAVIALGVLHHVPNPGVVVAEMMRVARRAVFISDSNIYGRGTRPARLAKRTLSLIGLLRPIDWIRRGGRHEFWSEGDGVAFSYSVFDSYRAVAASCARTIVVPLDGSGPSALLGSPHALLCGFFEF